MAADVWSVLRPTCSVLVCYFCNAHRSNPVTGRAHVC